MLSYAAADVLGHVTPAINRGSIYRFDTKPWDDASLRNNVRDAFRHYAQLHGAGPVTAAAALQD